MHVSGLSNYILKVRQSADVQRIEVFCDGKLVSTPRFGKVPSWRIKGEVIGAEFGEVHGGRCATNFEISLYVRDFSADGDKTVVRYSFSLDGNDIVLWSQEAVG